MVQEPLAIELERITESLTFLREDLVKNDYRRAVADLDSIYMAAQRAQEYLRNVERAAGPVPRASTAERVKKAQAAKAPTKRKPSNGTPLKEAVLDILRQAGEPMKLQDIATALEERGITLPGQGKPANLTVTLKRMKELDRPAYGQYALKKGV